MANPTYPGRTHRIENDRRALHRADVILHDGKAWAVVSADGRFHLRLMQGEYKGEYYMEANKAHGTLYRPIHPSMTAEDIEGATYAYDDGKYWLFAHCSPHEQVDFAANVEAFAVGQFNEAIQRSNALGARADGNQARNTAHAKSEALMVFARRVGNKAYKLIVGETLGHYHRNPHIDHKRDITVAIIRRELQTLRQNQESDPASRAMLGRVNDASQTIISRLTNEHDIEWRHEREQRIQLEDIKKAIRGTDPVGGHEYIFTAGKTSTPPTVSSDLPDPSWATDAVGNGTVRGDFTYYDGYPLTLGPDKPYVLAFKRATGTSSWSFVKAIKIYGGTS